jgi:hypothetical protein
MTGNRLFLPVHLYQDPFHALEESSFKIFDPRLDRTPATIGLELLFGGVNFDPRTKELGESSIGILLQPRSRGSKRLERKQRTADAFDAL